MRRALLALLASLVLLPAGAQADSVVIPAGGYHRIEYCYLPDPRGIAVGTGASYGTVTVPLENYWPGGGGWGVTYSLAPRWHVIVNSDENVDGPPSANRTLAVNDGDGTVIFYWSPAACEVH